MASQVAPPQAGLERLLGRFKSRHGQSRRIKEFVAVLLLYRDHDKEDVDGAVERALQLGSSDAASVKLLVDSSCESVPCLADLPKSLLPERVESMEKWVKPANVAIYNRLLTYGDRGPGAVQGEEGGIGHGN